MATLKSLIARLMLLAVLLGALPGCSSFAPEEPPVPDSTLVQVLVEMHLAEARRQLHGPIPPAMRDSILAHYGLDSTRMNAAMNHYSKHPAMYEELYGIVLDSLRTHDASSSSYRSN